MSDNLEVQERNQRAVVHIRGPRDWSEDRIKEYYQRQTNKMRHADREDIHQLALDADEMVDRVNPTFRHLANELNNKLAKQANKLQDNLRTIESSFGGKAGPGGVTAARTRKSEPIN